MKKIIITSLILLANSAFAQSLSVRDCQQGSNFSSCQLGVGPASSQAVTPNPGVTLPGVSAPTVDPTKSMNQLAGNSQPKGQYSSSISNIFVFCSGKRPSRASPLRPIYDQVCPNKNSAVAAPVLVDPSTGQQANFNLTPPNNNSNIKIAPTQNVQVRDGIVVDQTRIPTLVDPSTGKASEIKMITPGNKVEIPLLK